MDVSNFFTPSSDAHLLTTGIADVSAASPGNDFQNIGANLAATALSASGVPGGAALASIIKSVGGHPGPGKIYQADCEAAVAAARAKGVTVRWDKRAWTMTGHCVVTGADAWNVSLALMKGKGDPRVCKTLIPTESGICPVVCDQPSGGPAVGPQCRMPNASGKISGKSGAPSCLTQQGNCGRVKPDTGAYVPTPHNPAPSLTNAAHIQAVLRQGGTVADLSADQQYAAAKAALSGQLGLSSIFGATGGNSKYMLYLIIGGVAFITLVAAIKHG